MFASSLREVSKRRIEKLRKRPRVGMFGIDTLLDGGRTKISPHHRRQSNSRHQEHRKHRLLGSDDEENSQHGASGAASPQTINFTITLIELHSFYANC